jgi:hypothetical protein
MKQFLFVLLVLGITIPACAEVAVYNLKASNAGYGYNAGGNAWQIKDANTAFVILEKPSDGNTNAWAVYTWKGKDKKNYVMAENWGTLSFDEAWVSATKAKWVITQTDKQGRILLTGDVKQTTIGKPSKSCSSFLCHSSDEIAYLNPLTYEMAPSLAGYAITDKTDANSNRVLRTTTLALKLNTKMTLGAHKFFDTAEDEAKVLVGGFASVGYIDVTEP